MEIDAIVFDLGGVIIEMDYTRFFNEVIFLSPLNKPSSSLLLDFWERSAKYHQGLMNDTEFFKQSCEDLLHCPVDKETFYDSFNSVISSLNLPIYQLIKDLRDLSKYKLLLLSNINVRHTSYLKKQNWDVFELFDEVILSHRLKLMKPQRAIFEHTIEKAGVPPEKILLIDDGMNNVKMARSMGFNAIKFTNYNELVNELRETYKIDV